MGKKFLLLTLSLLLITLTIHQTLATEKPVFEIDKGGAITAHATNARLQDLLKNFSTTFNIEVRGTPTTTEPININLSRATFDETLKRLLRGYNYVLIQDDQSKRPAVVILGKAERTKYVDEPSPVQQQALAAAAPPPPSPASYGTVSPQQSISPAQSPEPPRKSGSVDQPKKQDEPVTDNMVASARPGRSLRSDTPPMPPQIPGLELPPMPPSLAEVRGSGQTVALDSPPQIPGENSSGQAALQTPPEMPAGDTTTQQKPKPTLDLRDLAPPSIPF
jgi:hypothetical protein